MTIKKLDFCFKVKSEDLTDDGSFRGYGSVFDVVDSYKDVIVKGAFEESLKRHAEKGSLPALLWQHNPDEPIGVYTQMKEDDHGLYVEGKLALLTTRGREAYELLKMGAVRGLSIGFNVPRGGEEWDEKNGVNVIKSVDLWETSVVTFPANEEAKVAQVRQRQLQAMKDSPKEFEKALRDALGFSRSEAKAIVAEGFKGLSNQRDVEGDDQGELTEGLKELTALFKSK